MTTKAATSAVSGASGGGKTVEESQDDFNVPSSTATEPDNGDLARQNAGARMEGLGISNTTMDPSLFSSEEFSQTKDSSDDLVADASITGTPSPRRLSGGNEDMNGYNPPTTPSPVPQKKEPKGVEEATPSPHRIPKYKIALASHLLSPSRTPVS